MLEGVFFTYLLEFLREHKVSCYFSKPLKSIYPCVKIEHTKTERFFKNTMVSFKATCIFDDVNQGQKAAFCQGIEDLLEAHTHAFLYDAGISGIENIYRCVMRCEKGSASPHEPGKLSTYVIECTARLARCPSNYCIEDDVQTESESETEDFDEVSENDAEALLPSQTQENTLQSTSKNESQEVDTVFEGIKSLKVKDDQIPPTDEAGV